jgi:raffinose/stachyose/melibiose transport system substrate-binding protein
MLLFSEKRFSITFRRKKMKKLVGLFLSLVMLTMSLNSVFAGGRAQGSNARNAKEVVLFMESSNIPDRFIADFFKDFETSSGYKVNVIIGGEHEVYAQDLAVALNSGQQIDALFCNGQEVRGYAARGIIEELTPLVNYWDRFNQNSIDQYTYSGKSFAIPIQAVGTSGIFTNNTVLRKYNLTPPRTYDDLINARDALARDNIAVFGFGGGSKYMWPMWFFCTFNQTSGNKAMTRTEAALRGQAKWTDRDYVDAMAILERMGKDKLFQNGVNGADTAQGLAVFSSGNAAFFFGGTWERGGFRESGMDGDKLGLVPFPIVVPGAKSEQTGSAGGQGLCILKGLSPERQKIALDLISYISSDAKVQQLSEYEPGSPDPKPNKAFKGIANSDSLFASVINPVLAPSTVTFLDWIWPPEIVTAFQDQIQAVTGGQTTATAAMAYIQRVFDGLVANGYNFDATN